MKPDFSGEYVLDRRASALSAGAAAIQSGRVRIDHREPSFRYSAAFAADGAAPLEYSFELVTDGREVSSAENEVSRLYWDGDALVAEHRAGTPHPVFAMTWRYELLEGGRLRATEHMRGGRRDQENVWEFDRQ